MPSSTRAILVDPLSAYITGQINRVTHGMSIQFDLPPDIEADIQRPMGISTAMQSELVYKFVRIMWILYLNPRMPCVSITTMNYMRRIAKYIYHFANQHSDDDKETALAKFARLWLANFDPSFRIGLDYTTSLQYVLEGVNLFAVINNISHETEGYIHAGSVPDRWPAPSSADADDLRWRVDRLRGEQSNVAGLQIERVMAAHNLVLYHIYPIILDDDYYTTVKRVLTDFLELPATPIREEARRIAAASVYRMQAMLASITTGLLRDLTRGEAPPSPILTRQTAGVWDSDIVYEEEPLLADLSTPPRQSSATAVAAPAAPARPAPQPRPRVEIPQLDLSAILADPGEEAPSGAQTPRQEITIQVDYDLDEEHYRPSNSPPYSPQSTPRRYRRGRRYWD